MADEPAAIGRTCGACRLCCKLFPLPVLEKAAGQWCRFVSRQGCSIHNGGRPQVCREYACYWLDHVYLPEWYRPDRLAIVVTDWGHVAVGGELLRVLLFHQSHRLASGRAKAQAMLADVIARDMVAMLVCGQEVEIVYDRVRYPSLSAREIEVALRYEQSQGAEELRRRGVVAADFRPLTRAEAEALVEAEGRRRG